MRIIENLKKNFSWYLSGILAIVAASLFYAKKEMDAPLAIWWAGSNLSTTGCEQKARQAVDKLSGFVTRADNGLIFGSVHDRSFVFSCLTPQRAVHVSSIHLESDTNTAKQLLDIYQELESLEGKDSPLINRTAKTTLQWNKSSTAKAPSQCVSAAIKSAERLDLRKFDDSATWVTFSTQKGDMIAVTCDNISRSATITINSKDVDLLAEFTRTFDSVLLSLTPTSADQSSGLVELGNSSWKGDFTYSTCLLAAKNILNEYKIKPSERNGVLFFNSNEISLQLICDQTGNSVFLGWGYGRGGAVKLTEVNEIIGKLQTRIK
jgi:hypothetical protein